jgi:multidrug resistance efflux pump
MLYKKGRGIRVSAIAPGVIETDMPSFTETEAGCGLALEMQALKRIGQPSSSTNQLEITRSVNIAPLVAGPIIKIPVHDNYEVKAGDLLFEIDPADYLTALASAKASVANLEANLLQKQQDLDRETDLFRRNVDSKQLFQNAQNAFAEAQAELDAARANLKQAELNLSYTKVYAPVDGYLTNFNTSPGAYVHVGDQLLALVDSSSFWIAAYFKETQLVSIQPSRDVKLTLMGYHDQPFAGTIQSVAWGIFVQDGSGGNSTGLLAAVNQTVDWVRLPQRFPVRIKITGKPPIPLRIGQTVTVAVEPNPLPKSAG